MMVLCLVQILLEELKQSNLRNCDWNIFRLEQSSLIEKISSYSYVVGTLFSARKYMLTHGYFTKIPRKALSYLLGVEAISV